MKLLNLKKWLEDRTGLPGALGKFLEEPIPASAGWRNTLGSIAGALIVVQLISGSLLMIFYVPHPEAAYESLKFIETSLSGGGLVRALHYWGASFIVVALFVHIIRVFFTGAYRKPREVTWVIGVVLLLVVMGLAFTGQLLPWDQKGYWAAKVGVEIGSSTPLVGPIVKQLLLGGDSVGALSLIRFYAMHVLFLPATLAGLILLHLYLLRRHGPAKPVDETATVSFFPVQVARDAVAISVALAGLLIVALILKGPDSLPADPADTSYVPRPEWYFLSHFELLRYTPGSLKLVTTFFLPSLLITLLLGLPWLDRAAGTSLRERRFIIGGGTLGFASIVMLTAAGLFAHSEAEPKGSLVAYDKVAAGRERYDQFDCQSCHRIDGEGQDLGPDLSAVGLRLKADYMKRWIASPQSFIPDTDMPPAKATKHEIDEIAAYLQTLVQPPTP